MSQTFNERSAHPTMAQTEILLDNLEQNPDMAKGFLRTQHARQRSKTFWEKMQLQLNSVSGGAVKSWKQWMKYWTDKKSATKKKAAMRAANRCKTGDGAGVQVELTAVEERILAILGGEKFATCDSSLRIPLILETEPSDTPHARDVLEFEVVTETEAETEQLTEVNVMNKNTTETLDSLLPPPDHVPENLKAESDTSQTTITEAESTPFSRPSTPFSRPNPVRTQTPPRRQRTFVTTSPRRRRRIRSSHPPSQRHSQFARTTERFLRLEERRMEMEAQNASLLRTLLERTAQREQTLLEALTNVGNLLIQQQSQHIVILNEHHSRQNTMMTEALRTLGEGLGALSSMVNRHMS